MTNESRDWLVEVLTAPDESRTLRILLWLPKTGVVCLPTDETLNLEAYTSSPPVVFNNGFYIYTQGTIKRYLIRASGSFFPDPMWTGQTSDGPIGVETTNGPGNHLYQIHLGVGPTGADQETLRSFAFENGVLTERGTPLLLLDFGQTQERPEFSLPHISPDGDRLLLFRAIRPEYTVDSLQVFLLKIAADGSPQVEADLGTFDAPSAQRGWPNWLFTSDGQWLLREKDGNITPYRLFADGTPPLPMFETRTNSGPLIDDAVGDIFVYQKPALQRFSISVNGTLGLNYQNDKLFGDTGFCAAACAKPLISRDGSGIILAELVVPDGVQVFWRSAEWTFARENQMVYSLGEQGKSITLYKVP